MRAGGGLFSAGLEMCINPPRLESSVLFFSCFGVFSAGCARCRAGANPLQRGCWVLHRALEGSARGTGAAGGQEVSAQRPQTHGLVLGWSRGLAVLLSWQRRMGWEQEAEREDIWGPGGWVTGLPSPCAFQNGRFLGDADLERQKFPDLKLNGPQVRGKLWFWAAPVWVGALGCWGRAGGVPHPAGRAKTSGLKAATLA